jgi:hypothetical protein
MPRAALHLAILLVTMAMLPGCRSGVDSVPPMPPPDQPPYFQSKPAAGSPWAIEGALVPSPPMANRPVWVLLTIKDGRGEPVRDATVQGTPLMPLMAHGGAGDIAFTAGKKGIWSGQTTFSMAGDWDVVVTVNSGGQTAKHTFSFVVSEPK